MLIGKALRLSEDVRVPPDQFFVEGFDHPGDGKRIILLEHIGNHHDI